MKKQESQCFPYNREGNEVKISNNSAQKIIEIYVTSERQGHRKIDFLLVTEEDDSTNSENSSINSQKLQIHTQFIAYKSLL